MTRRLRVTAVSDEEVPLPDGQALPIRVEACPCAPGDAHLTHREIEVLVLAAAGMTNRHIGHVLGISARTVDLHVETMRRRTGATCRGELIARCYAAGVLAIMVWPPAWSGSRCVTLLPATA
ncbi:MAG: response regulator transcription factor [Streptosporangiaceae bacterium]